jgi:hypothetical protein
VRERGGDREGEREGDRKRERSMGLTTKNVKCASMMQKEQK